MKIQIKRKKKNKNLMSGLSIIEVIIATAIFSLISVSMVTMTTGSFVGLIQGGEQTEAEALAQEGIEAVKAIYDEAWNRIQYTTSAVEISGNKWIFTGEGTTEIIGQFTRNISFANVCRGGSNEILACPGVYTDVQSKKVTISVTWNTRNGISNTVERIAYITNWDSREWTQTDWVNQSGQNTWSNQTRYDTDNNNIDPMTIGEAKLVYDWSTPALVSSLDINTGSLVDTEARDIYVLGNYAYVGTNINANAPEFYIYDVTNRASPTLAGSLEIGFAVNHVYISGNYAYLATEDVTQELKVIDISNPSSLSINGFYDIDASIGKTIFVVGTTAYIGTQNDVINEEFYILDVSDVENITLSGSREVGGTVSDIFVSGNYAYLTSLNSTKEFLVYDISDPASITETITKNLGAQGNGVFVRNSRAYVTTNNDGANEDFFIYDVSSPATSMPLSGSIDLDSNNNKVTVFGGYAFITSNKANSQLIIVDIVPATNPQLFSIFALDDAGDGIDLKSGYIYIATKNITKEMQILSSTTAGPRFITSGNFISSAFNMNDSSPVHAVEWDRTIPPCSPTCTITLDISSAPDSGGSPGTWTSWQNATTHFGTLLPISLNDNQWVRYRANFTSDGISTPVLSEIRINYK